jgi:hypothetical protein
VEDSCLASCTRRRTPATFLVSSSWPRFGMIVFYDPLIRSSLLVSIKIDRVQLSSTLGSMALATAGQGHHLQHV